MKKQIPILAALFAFIALISAPDAAISSCRYGLRLCAELIIPTLFPFFVLSILLNILGLPSFIGKVLAPAAARIYRISGAGASALIIGLTGGYPLGAAYIADMERNGAIDAEEGERLMGFCSNSGPAFIIGAVGSGVFHSGMIGILLYAIHIISAMITGLFFRSGEKCELEYQPPRIDEVVPAAALVEAVKRASASLCLSLAAGIVGWGGLSVQMQTAAVLYDSNIKGTLYLTGRLISAILSSVLAYLAGCVMF